MAYEYPTQLGVIRLVQIERLWIMEFKGGRRGEWRTADEAALAVAKHRSGHRYWDRKRCDASDDLLDWRPIGDSL